MVKRIQPLQKTLTKRSVGHNRNIIIILLICASIRCGDYIISEEITPKSIRLGRSVIMLFCVKHARTGRYNASGYSETEMRNWNSIAMYDPLETSVSNLCVITITSCSFFLRL